MRGMKEDFNMLHTNYYIIQNIIEGKESLKKEISLNKQEIISEKYNVLPNRVIKNKIFVIGHNKTGTSSITTNIMDLGFKIGNQRKSESFLKSYLSGDFSGIINHAKSADAFKDVPFSLKNTYKHLDSSFPNSKFILTIRDNEYEWYDSVIKSRKMENHGKIPNSDELKRRIYGYKNFLYDFFTGVYKTNDNDLFNKKKLTEYYLTHNQEVIEYFKDRPNDLLVINLKEPNGYEKFCTFLGIEDSNGKFYHLNKSII